MSNILEIIQPQIRVLELVTQGPAGPPSPRPVDIEFEQSETYAIGDHIPTSGIDMGTVDTFQADSSLEFFLNGIRLYRGADPTNDPSRRIGQVEFVDSNTIKLSYHSMTKDVDRLIIIKRN